MANANTTLTRPAAYGWQRAIFSAGLVAGALDITAAFTQYGLQGISPVRILHSIASGLLGAAAYSGGAPTAVLGAFLHFVIATSAATVYHFSSRRIQALLQHPVVFGALFGIAVYFFMNLVVLPLSAFPRKLTFPPKALLTGLLIHVFCVGLPIALINRLYTEQRSRRNNEAATTQITQVETNRAL